jgi:hypothetical protein
MLLTPTSSEIYLIGLPIFGKTSRDFPGGMRLTNTILINT